MKKLQVFIIFFILFLSLASIAKAGFSAIPAELTITMQNNFCNGNTSKKISVTNNNPDELNITWYIEHPYETKIRPNKTFIPSLNWIDVNPKYIILSPGETSDFYIYLNIPEKKENLNQNWEVWVTFKKGYQDQAPSMFQQEIAIRTYIDTPSTYSEINLNDGLYATTGSETNMLTTVELGISIILILSILIMALFIYNRRKKE